MAKQAKQRYQRQKIRAGEYTRPVRQVLQACAICGRETWGSPLKRYCSIACQMKANYQRNGEKYRKARMERYRAATKGGKLKD
jgi:hypothetical protein